MEKFKTIENNAMAEIEEKRSKFIANLYYVQSVEEAESKIKEIKKKYYYARHNCYAYIIKEEVITKKSSDDGEPSGTAGSPILNVLEKNNLINVLLIVTRYFGGILLGTGGLVRAYTEAAVKVIETAKIIERQNGYEAEIVIEYQDIDKFNYYCEKNNIKIISSDYTDNVKYIIEITEDEKDILSNNMADKKIVNVLSFKIIGRKSITK